MSKAQPGRIRVGIDPGQLDELVGPSTPVTPDTVDEVVERSLDEVFKLRREKKRDEARIDALDGKVTAAERAAKRDAATIARCEAVIRALREEFADESRESGSDGDESLFERLVRLRGGVVVAVLLLAAFAAPAALYAVLPEGTIVNRATVSEALAPEELERAREADVEGIGRVRALQFRYVEEHDAYLVDVEVTPSVDDGVNFLAVSPSYSSLVLGSRVLAVDPRARIGGTFDLDEIVADWGKTGGSVSQLRRAIDRRPGCQIAPGRAKLVTVAFAGTPGADAFDADWGRVSLLFWSSETIAALDPTAKFGTEILDAAYAAESSGVRSLDEPIRVELAVPRLAASGSTDGAGGAAGQDPETAKQRQARRAD